MLHTTLKRCTRPGVVFPLCFVMLLCFSFPELELSRWASSSASKYVVVERPEENRVEILLTNYGWNHPNQTIGLTFGRSIRQRELLRGIQSHPSFHPFGWEKYLQNDASSLFRNDTRYYVFLDVETCFESNWPTYGGLDRNGANGDTANNRTAMGSSSGVHSSCKSTQQVLGSPLFNTPGVDARLVIFECRGFGPSTCYKRDDNNQDPRVVLASLSAHVDQHLTDGMDMGLPPPAVTPVHLTEAQERAIESCEDDGEFSNRTYLLTFVGNFRTKIRKELLPLDNDRDVIVRRRVALRPGTPLHGRNYSFDDLLSRSRFVACPRGDNLFSYRFTEILSAGAIPVVISDGWVLPFRKELIEWREAAVIVPEAQTNRTLEYISNITAEERCRMRREGYRIYQRYMATPEATIKGIIESLESTWEARYHQGRRK